MDDDIDLEEIENILGPGDDVLMDDDIDLDEIQNILQPPATSYYGITGEDKKEWAEKVSCGVWSLPRTWTLRTFRIHSASLLRSKHPNPFQLAFERQTLRFLVHFNSSWLQQASSSVSKSAQVRSNHDSEPNRTASKDKTYRRYHPNPF